MVYGLVDLKIPIRVKYASDRQKAGSWGTGRDNKNEYR